MTRRRRLGVAATLAAAVAAATAFAATSVSHHHPMASTKRLDGRALTALAVRFVNAATDRRNPSGEWSAIVVQPLADNLLGHHTGTCAGGGRVVNIDLSPTQPPSASVIAECTSSDNGPHVALVWVLRFTLTSSGWRIAAVSS